MSDRLGLSHQTWHSNVNHHRLECPLLCWSKRSSTNIFLQLRSTLSLGKQTLGFSRPYQDEVHSRPRNSGCGSNEGGAGTCALIMIRYSVAGHWQFTMLCTKLKTYLIILSCKPTCTLLVLCVVIIRSYQWPYSGETALAH